MNRAAEATALAASAVRSYIARFVAPLLCFYRRIARALFVLHAE